MKNINKKTVLGPSPSPTPTKPKPDTKPERRTTPWTPKKPSIKPKPKG